MSPSRRRTYVIDGISPVIDTAAFVHPDAVLIGDVVVGPENNWSQKSVLQTTASRPSKILFALPTYSVDRSIGQDYDEAGFKSDALVLNFGPVF